MSSQFIQRLANYLANEVLVKGLAQSRTFQHFAVRTDAAVKEMQKTGTEKLSSTFEELSKQQVRNASTSAMQGPPQKPLTGVPGFFSAFGKEIRKDMFGK